MQSVCVFCGGNAGTRPEYSIAADVLGRALADRGIGLVYGGASVGLMGRVADSVLSAGGRVVGVIPRLIADRELAHNGLTELHVVGSMLERKERMASLADAFVALPGGLGTLDEIFEVLTWSQLDIHDKPCGVLNVSGFYTSLLAFLDNAMAEGFIKPPHRAELICDDDTDALLDRLAAIVAARDQVAL